MYSVEEVSDKDSTLLNIRAGIDNHQAKLTVKSQTVTNGVGWKWNGLTLTGRSLIDVLCIFAGYMCTMI